MFNLMNKRLNKKGFTLIELIVVIAIIAILAVILIPRFTGLIKSANEKAAISDTRNILLAVQALHTQGDPSITATEIQNYTGTTFGGTISPDPITSDDFTYTIQLGTDDYTVTVTDFEIQPTVSSAPHA